jgi:HlyD family secretion protein
MLVSEFQVLVNGGEFLKRLEPVPVHHLLVGHQVLKKDAAMRAYLSVWDSTLFKLLDEERTRDIEEVGRLLRGQFGVDGDQRHGIALSHFGKNVIEQAEGGQRNGNGFLQVELDRALVEQSHKQHLVAQRNATAATEQVAQAKADVNRYTADVQRWDSEVKRLTGLVSERVVDKQVLDETRRQLQSSQAALEASRAAVKTRDAQRLAAEATTEKTKVDISAAEAKVKVAMADERRLGALVDYLTVNAPYDGVVFARNVNLGDFVTPAAGDPTQGVFSVGVSPGKATPLYVLNRTDPVLFVVGVPEADSAYIAAGSKARIRVPALANHEFPAKVTRTSWALNATSRTLRAQVELPNPKGKFLPGMYAYGSVFIEREHVRALPGSAITQIGNQTYCYLALEGKAVRTPVQTGVSDGAWVEVTGKLVHPAAAEEGTWEAFDGNEAVIAGDLLELSDGAPIRVEPGQ